MTNTDPTTGPSTPPLDPAQDLQALLLGQLGVTYGFETVAHALLDVAKQHRAAAGETWGQLYADPAAAVGDHLDVRLPGLGPDPVAKATLKVPKAEAVVTDEAAFLEGQKRGNPQNVTCTIEIVVPAGFGADETVDEIRKLIEGTYGRDQAYVKSARWTVQDAWRRGLLRHALGVPGGPAVSKTGEEIAGTKMRPAADPTSFAFPAAGRVEAAKKAILRALLQPEALETATAAPLTGARTVDGEVIDGEHADAAA